MDLDIRENFIKKPTWPDIMEALHHSDTLHAQSQLLGIILEREGPYFCVHDGTTVKDRLERLMRQAGALRHWSVVRFCSSILKKLVDSISPYITSVLVNGKQITIGSFGAEETLIDHPLTPKEIHALIYSTIHDPYEAVLQQEMILYVGRLISTIPHLFHGILKIRMGSLLEAIKLYLRFKGEEHVKLESLSPSQIRKVLYRVLTDDDLSMHEKRKIEGAFCRVPRDFYDKVWEILRRIPGGITIADQHLDSSSILNQMTKHELNFSLLVEKQLGRISCPEYRHICMEVNCH